MEYESIVFKMNKEVKYRKHKTRCHRKEEKYFFKI